MHNLWTVISFEFLRTIKKKTFWLTILAFPALMIIVVTLSIFSSQSASQSEEQAKNERFSVTIMDDSKLLDPAVLEALHARAATGKEAGVEAVRRDQVEAFFYYPADPSKQPVEVYGRDVGLIKNDKYTAVAEQLLKTSVTNAVGSAEKVAIIQSGVTSKLVTYHDGQETDRAKQLLVPVALVVLFYLIIILLGNQMLASTTEEKENRVMEMILTAVAARTLIIGKIIALIALGLVQITVIVVPALVVGLKFGNKLHLPNLDLSQLQIDPLQVTVQIVLFVCSFMLFTGILVAIGASMPTAKEANNFFGLAIFGMSVPLYALSAIMAEPGQLIVQFFSFFPLTAPITLMLRNAVGNLQPWEMVIGAAILLVSALVALVVATRAFSYGTLEYSRKLSLRELWPR